MIEQLSSRQLSYVEDDVSTETYDHIELLAARIVRWATGSHAVLAIMILLAAWVIFGPLVGFSNDWQSSMTVPATAITFVLVFLILRAQNKDTRAIQLKLNEIIASLNGANNELIDIESMSEKTLDELHRRYEAVANHVKGSDTQLGTTDAIAVHEVADAAIYAEAVKEDQERSVEKDPA